MGVGSGGGGASCDGAGPRSPGTSGQLVGALERVLELPQKRPPQSSLCP